MKYTTANVQQLKSRKGKPWQARLKYKDVATGKWKEITKMLPEATGKKSAQRLANAWLDEMNEAANNSPNIAAEKTVLDVITEYVEYQYATGQLERSTYANQLYSIKNYVKPYIGDYSFATFDRDAVNNWLTKLNNAGLRQDTIYSVFATVRKVFNYYHNMGELLRNPFAGVKSPKQQSRTTHLTPEQMDDVIAAVYSEYSEEDFMYAAVLLAFYGGLRRGEICGLKWNNVDLDRKLLSIENAVGTAYGFGGAYTKQPKNKSSIRTFPMVPQLVLALQQIKEKKKPSPQDFVCGGRTYIQPQRMDDDFFKFVRRNELKDAYGKYITLHSLRHNLGYVGVRSGMDIASLSRMFGHANRAMTLNTYSDTSPDAMKIAASKLSDKFDEETEFFKRADIEPIEE